MPEKYCNSTKCKKERLICCAIWGGHFETYVKERISQIDDAISVIADSIHELSVSIFYNMAAREISSNTLRQGQDEEQRQIYRILEAVLG